MTKYKYQSTDDELYHHGVKGQKWGVRNGPPYPLDASQKLRWRDRREVSNEVGKMMRKNYEITKDNNVISKDVKTNKININAINKQIEQNAKKNGTSIGVERAKYVQTMLGTGKGHEGFWNNFWNDGSARWESTAGQRAVGIAAMVLGGANGRFESWNVRRLGTMDSFLNNYLEASYNNFVDR